MSKDMAMTDLSFGVRGNCGMCKNTIEKAANGVEGVASANWDVDKKKIDVSFDDTKTDAMAIHKAIAASGYDTEKVAGDEEAYDGLPGCCKYDHEMMMNQSGEEKSDDHSNHDH
jgi:copper chaperone CopZ